MTNCEFTETHYCEIIRAFMEAGYRFTGFNEFLPESTGQIILRHDVDLALEEALRIARLEAKLGVTSVYQILLTAEIYNPMSAAGQAVIKELRKLGHRIGLHVDPVVYNGGRIDRNFFTMLEQMFETAHRTLGPLDSYSIHRPAARGKAEDLQPEHLPFRTPPYAYSDKYFKNILYRSDSRREWRQGCVCRQITEMAGQSIQLVTHPIWWTTEPQSREQVLQVFLEQRKVMADSYLAANLSFYKTNM